MFCASGFCCWLIQVDILQEIHLALFAALYSTSFLLSRGVLVIQITNKCTIAVVDKTHLVSMPKYQCCWFVVLSWDDKIYTPRKSYSRSLMTYVVIGSDEKEFPDAWASLRDELWRIRVINKSGVPCLGILGVDKQIAYLSPSIVGEIIPRQGRRHALGKHMITFNVGLSKCLLYCQTGMPHTLKLNGQALKLTNMQLIIPSTRFCQLQ